MTDRRLGEGDVSAGAGSITIELPYRAPYSFEPIISFFRARQLDGVELVGDSFYSRTVSMDVRGTIAKGWLCVENDASRNVLVLTLSESLASVTDQVAERIRRQFDLDCDPQKVAAGIASLDQLVPGAVKPGVRLPGCFDAFETACRAVLGQQISVAAANRMAARIVEAYGDAVDTGIEGLDHAFPTAEKILELDAMSAEELSCTCCDCGRCDIPGTRLLQGDSGGAEAAFGHLGVIRSRSRTIAELARQVEEGTLRLSPDSDIAPQMEALMSTKGIGPWSANYIAMRTISYPDAFLETDVGIKHALPDMSATERLQAAEEWRPWRSYANICLWQSLE